MTSQAMAQVASIVLIQRMAFICQGLVMVAILWAGVLKSHDLASFAESLEQWRVVPVGWGLAFATFVEVAEITIGFSWIIGLHRSRMAITGVAFLVLVTAAFLVESAVGGDPECFCFGEKVRLARHLSEVQSLLIRNGVLLVLLLGGSIVLAVGRNPATRSGAPS